MATLLFDLLPYLRLGEQADGINPHHAGIVAAIKKLPMTGDSKVGFFGGYNAFVDVDDVATKGKRDTYIMKTFAVKTLQTRCKVHGLSALSIGHVFPRVFGGVMLKNQRVNIRLECTHCNQAKHSLLTPEQVLYTKTIWVDYDLTPTPEYVVEKKPRKKKEKTPEKTPE